MLLQLNPRTASRMLNVTRRPDQPQKADGDSRTSLNVPVYEAELWTSRQRQASPIHEISYRACFKPQLPAYFIERLTRDARVLAIGGGATEVMLEEVAKRL